MILKSVEKALRLPEDHPMCETFHGASPQRVERQCCKSRANELLARAGIENVSRKPIKLFCREPWQDHPDFDVHCEIPGVSGRNDTMEIKKSQAEKCINSMNAEFVIYPDGSASASTKNKGARVAITRGVAENPTVIKELRVKCAQLTCSY